jgi:S-adenosylmethionine synthetase
LKPKYRKTSNYGHFGRNLPELTWERTDKIDAVRDAVNTLKRL